MKNSPTRIRLLIFVLVAVAISFFQLRVASSYYKAGNLFEATGSASYRLLADSIIETGGASLTQSPVAGRPPLYPILLALLGMNVKWVLFAQSLLAGMTLGIISILTIRLTHRDWTILVVFGFYILIYEIALENIRQRETVLFTFLLVLAGLLFDLAEENRSKIFVVLLGMVMGLACLTRPLAHIALFFVLIWTAWMLGKGIYPKKEIIARAVFFLITFLLVLIPWGIRNYFVMGRPILTSTTRGVNLWKGNNPATMNIYPDIDVDYFGDLLRDTPPERGWWDVLRPLNEMSELEQNDYLTDLATAYIREDPLAFVIRGFVKTWSLWSPSQVPKYTAKVEWTTDGAQYTPTSGLRGFTWQYVVIYLLAIIGILYRRKHPFILFILMLVVFWSALSFLTFGESRFRWPVNVLSLPLAATGLYALLSYLTRRLQNARCNWFPNTNA